jgi:hypothetical protein
MEPLGFADHRVAELARDAVQQLAQPRGVTAAAFDQSPHLHGAVLARGAH